MTDLFRELFFDDKRKYFTVIEFFSWILGKQDGFKSIIHYLAEEKGYQREGLGCFFSNIFESSDEEGYFKDGVGFYFGADDSDDIVIDYEMFVKCVELAYSIYSEANGRDKQIEKDIAAMHERYSV